MLTQMETKTQEHGNRIHQMETKTSPKGNKDTTMDALSTKWKHWHLQMETHLNKNGFVAHPSGTGTIPDWFRTASLFLSDWFRTTRTGSSPDWFRTARTGPEPVPD